MYIKHINIAIKRIISFLNLDINSNSAGSFDRYFWGWKKKDFQDSTLIFSLVPLIKALKIINKSSNQEYISKENVHYFHSIILNNIKNAQRTNGSFDQSYPYENHPKIGLDFSSVLYNFLKLEKDEEIELIYKKTIDYSLISEEKYGIICNHLAHHAYEYLLAYSYFKEKRYYERALENINIININTDEEGWHLEYLGADAGYQTRTLKYLTKCINLLNRKDKNTCKELCLKSIDFLNKLILPDGTIYEMFGSRNTAIIYPSGIEYMAYYYPLKFSDLAIRIRNSIKQGFTILPLQLEFDNFIRLFEDYLDAYSYYENNRNVKRNYSELKEFDLKNFGYKMQKRKNYKIFIHYKYGGMIAVYKKDKLICKDGGFIIKRSKEKYFGTKNNRDFSNQMVNEEFVIRIDTNLYKSIHQDLTPFKLIIIRILNLTFLRFLFFADLFRKIIVKKIMEGKNNKYGGVWRTIKINKNNIIIEDKFKLKYKPKKIYRTVNQNLFHMASSRYFQDVNRKLVLYKQELAEGKGFDLRREIQLN